MQRRFKNLTSISEKKHFALKETIQSNKIDEYVILAINSPFASGFFVVLLDGSPGRMGAVKTATKPRDTKYEPKRTVFIAACSSAPFPLTTSQNSALLHWASGVAFILTCCVRQDPLPDTGEASLLHQSLFFSSFWFLSGTRWLIDFVH